MIELSSVLATAPKAKLRPALLAEAGARSFALAMGPVAAVGGMTALPRIALDSPPLVTIGRQSRSAGGKDLPADKDSFAEIDDEADAPDGSEAALAWFPAALVPLPPVAPPKLPQAATLAVQGDASRLPVGSADAGAIEPGGSSSTPLRDAPPADVRPLPAGFELPPEFTPTAAPEMPLDAVQVATPALIGAATASLAAAPVPARAPSPLSDIAQAPQALPPAVLPDALRSFAPPPGEALTAPPLYAIEPANAATPPAALAFRIAPPAAPTPAPPGTTPPAPQIAAPSSPTPGMTPSAPQSAPDIAPASRAPAATQAAPALAPLITLQPMPQAAAAAALLDPGVVDRRLDRRDPVSGITGAAAGLSVAAQPLDMLRAAADVGQQSIDMRRQEWPGQMVEQIEAMRDASPAGDTRIRLAPDALGTVDIAIRHEGGRIHVHFTADAPAARQALSDAQPRLAEIAEARGLKLGQTSVDGGGAGQGSGGRRHDGGPQSPRAPRAHAFETTADDDRIA